jgi:hypothetical protein
MSNQEHIYCVHDKIYNISDFVNKHPGGTNAFANLQSHTDITPLIYSYHKDSAMIFEVLSKYEVQQNDAVIQYKSNFKYDKYVELKKLVYNEIGEKGLPLYWSNYEIF